MSALFLRDRRDSVGARGPALLVRAKEHLVRAAPGGSAAARVRATLPVPGVLAGTGA
jgi:hypothetical protein